MTSIKNQNSINELKFLYADKIFKIVQDDASRCVRSVQYGFPNGAFVLATPDGATGWMALMFVDAPSGSSTESSLPSRAECDVAMVGDWACALQAAGGVTQEDGTSRPCVEVSPLASYAGEGLQDRARGLVFTPSGTVMENLPVQAVPPPTESPLARGVAGIVRWLKRKRE